MAVTPIPEGYHTVTPYLVVQGVPKLLDFLKQAFDAQEIMRMPWPDGTIMHAEVRVGDSAVMMGEARGEFKPMLGSCTCTSMTRTRRTSARCKRVPPR